MGQTGEEETQMVAKMKGKNVEAALAEQLIAGTNKHLATVGQLMLASGTFTPAQVTGELQTLVNLRTDVDGTRAALAAKVAAEALQIPALHSFMATFVAFVKAAFSKSPDVLADFGLKPKKAPTPLTAEQKAAAAVKRAATRAARGTTSKKKKQAIKGDVTGIVVTPVTTSKPVAPAQQAPSAPVTATGSTTGNATPHGA
jgi:hypothetical protein